MSWILLVISLGFSVLTYYADLNNLEDVDIYFTAAWTTGIISIVCIITEWSVKK